MFLLNPINPTTFIIIKTNIVINWLYKYKVENIPTSNKNLTVYGRPENKIQEINIIKEKVGIVCDNPEI